VFVVPLASALCLALGPLVGFGVGAVVAVRGDRIAARWVVVGAIVLMFGDLLAAAVVWGGTAAGLYQIGEWLERVGLR
jgi:hypothetical protein